MDILYGYPGQPGGRFDPNFVARVALSNPVGQAIGRTTRSLFGLPGEITAEGLRGQEVVGAPTTSSRKVLRQWFEGGGGDGASLREAQGIAGILALQEMDKPITSLLPQAQKAAQGRTVLAPMGSYERGKRANVTLAPSARAVAEAEYLNMAAQVFEGAPGTISDAISQLTQDIRNRQAASGLFFSQAAASAEAAAEQGAVAQSQAAVGSSYWDLMTSTASAMYDPRGEFRAMAEVYDIGREYRSQTPRRPFINRRPLGT